MGFGEASRAGRRSGAATGGKSPNSWAVKPSPMWSSPARGRESSGQGAGREAWEACLGQAPQAAGPRGAGRAFVKIGPNPPLKGVSQRDCFSIKKIAPMAEIAVAQRCLCCPWGPRSCWWRQGPGWPDTPASPMAKREARETPCA